MCASWQESLGMRLHSPHILQVLFSIPIFNGTMSFTGGSIDFWTSILCSLYLHSVLHRWLWGQRLQGTDSTSPGSWVRWACFWGSISLPYTHIPYPIHIYTLLLANYIRDRTEAAEYLLSLDKPAECQVSDNLGNTVLVSMIRTMPKVVRWHSPLFWCLYLTTSRPLDPTNVFSFELQCTVEPLK